jgi:hypothetical protein
MLREQLIGALGEARHPTKLLTDRQHPPPMFHRSVDDSRRENLVTGDTEPHFDPRTKARQPQKHPDDTVSADFPMPCVPANLPWPHGLQPANAADDRQWVHFVRSSVG